jgi:hypothetical protein
VSRRIVRIDGGALRIEQRIRTSRRDIGTDVSEAACIYAHVLVAARDRFILPRRHASQSAEMLHDLRAALNVTVITTFQEASGCDSRSCDVFRDRAEHRRCALGMAAGGLIGDVWRSSIPVVFGACRLGIAILVPSARQGLASC